MTDAITRTAWARRRGAVLALGIGLALALGGCTSSGASDAGGGSPASGADTSGQGATEAPPDEVAPDEAPPDGQAPADAAASATWSQMCVLTTQEVDQLISPYGFRSSPAAPLNGDPTADECYYEDALGTSMGLGIAVRVYGPGESYGWGVDWNAGATSWAASDPAAAQANACAAATWTTPAGYVGSCENAAGVPVVYSPDQLTALLFPAGDYFSVVTLYGISGDEKAAATLRQAAALLAARPPLG